MFISGTDIRYHGLADMQDTSFALMHLIFDRFFFLARYDAGLFVPCRKTWKSVSLSSFFFSISFLLFLLLAHYCSS